MSSTTKKIAMVLVGAGLFYLVGARVYDNQQPTEKPRRMHARGRVITVEVVKSHLGYIQEDLLLTGPLKAKESVDVSPYSQGRVKELYFNVGDRIEKGTLIATLDDEELQQQVNRARASILVTGATLAQRIAERKNAQAELERATQLFKEGLLSPRDYDTYKTGIAVMNAQVELAKAQKQQAEAQLRELEIRLSRTKIYSPINGVVANRYVDVGALVSPGVAVIRVVNLTTMVTQGNVPERDIGRLRIGTKAVVRVDAMPGHVFTGKVARISPVLDAATRSALIEIDISNSKNLLKAEMFTRIELQLGSTREILLIPRESLVHRGDQSGVYIIHTNKPTFQPIEIGRAREDHVEVLTNLEVGAQIVGRGAAMLREGDQIRFENKESIDHEKLRQEKKLDRPQRTKSPNA